MPVIDHEIHESTIQKDGAKNGCWNKLRPMANSGYYAPQRRHLPFGKFAIELVFIPFRMSTECRYDQAIAPSMCEGCQWVGQGKAYAEQVMKGSK